MLNNPTQKRKAAIPSRDRHGGQEKNSLKTHSPPLLPLPPLDPLPDLPLPKYSSLGMDMAVGGVGLGTGGATGMVGATTGGELVPVATSVWGRYRSRYYERYERE